MVRERGQMAYKTGVRIVDMVKEDLTPSKIMTREAFENTIIVNSAIGGSTNAQMHITAIARHIGIELETEAWQNIGYDIPLMANIQPAGTPDFIPLVHQETIDKGNELLDNFSKMLEERGLIVDRPIPTDFSLPVITPDFSTDSQFGCMPPRDVLLTVGSESNF